MATNWVLLPQDRTILTSNFGVYADFTATGPVPEAGTALLLGLGMAGPGFVGRRRQ